jgi:transcriptional regulator with XRE-family HTH domain
MDQFRELPAELRSADPRWEKWRKARLAAGLTLRQAAKLIDIAPSELSLIERAEAQPLPRLAAAMANVYGAGPD